MKEDNVLQVYYEEKRVGILALTRIIKRLFQYDGKMAGKWIFLISPFSLSTEKTCIFNHKRYFSCLLVCLRQSSMVNWGVGC